MASPANATDHPITCDGSTTGQLNTLMTTTNFTQGDTVTITGICVGDTFIFPGLTFQNHTNPSVLSGTDGIEGMLTLNGNSVATTQIEGLTLEGAPSDNGDQANLHVTGGSVLNLSNSEVKLAQRDGIDVDENSSLTLQDTQIDGNGVANVNGKNNGIRVKKGGIVNDNSGAANSTIHNNTGFGLHAEGAYVELANTDMNTDTLSEIGAFGTYLNLGGGTITATGSLPAVQVIQASSVTLVGVTISGPAGGVMAASATGLLLAHATISTTSTTVPAVEATSASSLIITGGDAITASSGTAIEIDHSSSLLHQLLSRLDPGSGNAAESITGKGTILMQSSADLGQGPLTPPPPGAGPAPPTPSAVFSIVWNGPISVGQNSAIRMQSGVHVTGAVQISAASNGYFNCNNNGNSCSGAGAANEIDGTVQCLELLATPANPSVHVSNPQLIVNSSLAADSGVAVANLFGASSFATSTPAANTCLNF
ncbi:MAG TPA: hypothetical protein VGP48_02810 [Stellaceae bacterium]|nr:hypothetical protein [Stellaceae bacterium]